MVSRDGLKALTNGNMKIHKVLALPPSLEEDSIYFVKNGTGADLYIVSNEGTATKVSSGVDYGLTLGEEGDTAYRGDRGKFAYDHAQSPHVETKTDIGLGHVNNTSDLDKPISDDTQAALDTKAEPLTVSDSAPMSPDEGDLWFNSDIGQLYTYYTDGDSGQWVSAGGGFNNNNFDISDVQEYYDETASGYEFTGGFTDRTTGQSGANDLGTNTQYTTAMANAGSWYRFGFDTTRQAANDVAYFPTSSFENFDQTKGLFGGAHMPAGITDLIDYSFDDSGDADSYSDAVSTGSLQYNAATGSYDLTQCEVGDLVKVRFSFNAVPQVANSTLEVGLIFMTRDANDDPTFTFALTTQPVFYGTGSQGVAYLNRVEMSAYIASAEDLNARVLPAIRCNNEILIQPLSTLISIIR